MKYFLACAISAILGALLALYVTDSFTGPAAVAQDRGVAREPILLDDTQLDPRLRRQRGLATGSDVSLESFTPEERVNISVYEKVNRSVVHITTKSWSPEMFLMRDAPSEGAGSGSVIDHEGHILTNDHVIEGASQVRVTLFNGETFGAKLVGRDAANDTAVLLIDAPPKMLYPITWGDSANLRVGQKVFAIGNPFGLERTMTVGILSSINRTLNSRTGRAMKSILQIDAALNRGNSGGPLLDSRGELIGMNTAIASPSGAGENTGVGFSIPVSTIKRVVPQLLEHGRVIRPSIGIGRVFETDRGLLIINVRRGGAADQAGLRGFRFVRDSLSPLIYVDRSHADLIVAIDGRPVSSADDLLDAIERKKPGDRVVVAVIRDGRQADVLVTLDEDD